MMQNCIFRHEFDKNCSKSQFYEMRVEIQYACNFCVIWQYHSCDMYNHLPTISLIGVME